MPPEKIRTRDDRGNLTPAAKQAIADTNAAVYRVFHLNEPAPGDNKRVMELLVELCEVRARGRAKGLNGVIDAVVRDAKREVYYKFAEVLKAGARGAEAESPFGFEESGVDE